VRYTVIGTIALVFVMVGAVWAQDNVLTEQEEAQGWRLLFNGRDYTGWVNANEYWTVEDGCIATIPGGGGDIITEARYGDFILSADFMVTEGANSGIFFRIDDPGDVVSTGIEIQVLDSAGVETPGVHDCGAVYEIQAPVVNMARPVGEWQNITVLARNDLITVVHNGVPVVVMDLDEWTEPHRNPDGTQNKFPIAYAEMAREGHVALQHHGQRVLYKNVKILPLG
jgi:hypothetical protein